MAARGILNVKIPSVRTFFYFDLSSGLELLIHSLLQASLTPSLTFTFLTGSNSFMALPLAPTKDGALRFHETVMLASRLIL
jgi:hypothetical protein